MLEFRPAGGACRRLAAAQAPDRFRKAMAAMRASNGKAVEIAVCRPALMARKPGLHQQVPFSAEGGEKASNRSRMRRLSAPALVMSSICIVAM